jgi:hypothetical protein
MKIFEVWRNILSWNLDFKVRIKTAKESWPKIQKAYFCFNPFSDRKERSKKRRQLKSSESSKKRFSIFNRIDENFFVENIKMKRRKQLRRNWQFRSVFALRLDNLQNISKICAQIPQAKLNFNFSNLPLFALPCFA